MQARRFSDPRRVVARLAPILVLSVSLTGCFDDDPGASTGTQAGAVPTTSTGASATNSAPQVSGTPAAEIPAGFPYVFKPTVVDAEGDPLSFAVSGQPRWASFQAASGELRGTPADADVGEASGIIITVSDGRASTVYGPFSVRVKRPTTAQAGARPPTVVGTPPATAAAGAGYAFQVIAADPDGDRLTFGAQNLPAWLGLNTANGLVTGTPSAAAVGTHGNITISVTDGNTTASLQPFSIVVTPSGSATTPANGAAGTGTATLSWLKPTQNTDGTPLQDLAGYVVKYGNDPAALTRRSPVADSDLTRYTVPNLGRGTWYFTVVSYTATGLESDVAPVVSKTIS